MGTHLKLALTHLVNPDPQLNKHCSRATNKPIKL